MSTMLNGSLTLNGQDDAHWVSGVDYIVDGDSVYRLSGEFLGSLPDDIRHAVLIMPVYLRPELIRRMFEYYNRAMLDTVDSYWYRIYHTHAYCLQIALHDMRPSLAGFRVASFFNSGIELLNKTGSPEEFYRIINAEFAALDQEDQMWFYESRYCQYLVVLARNKYADVPLFVENANYTSRSSN